MDILTSRHQGKSSINLSVQSSTSKGLSPTTDYSRRPSFIPDLRPSVVPDRRPSLAPDRTQGLSPDRRPSLAPDRTQGLSPDRRPSLAPDRTQGLTPDRRPSLIPDRNRRPSFNPDGASISFVRRPSLNPDAAATITTSARRLSLNPEIAPISLTRRPSMNISKSRLSLNESGSDVSLNKNTPGNIGRRASMRGSNASLNERRQSSLLFPPLNESKGLSRKISLPYLMAPPMDDDFSAAQNFEELRDDLLKDRVRTKLSSVMDPEEAIMVNSKARAREQVEHIPGLSPEQKEFYAEAFTIFDMDGSGTIDMSEIKQVARSLGFDFTDKEINLMVRHVDDDGNGEISLEEFVHFLDAVIAKEKKASSIADDKTLDELFASMDADGDGFLGVNDVIAVLHYFGEKATPEAAHDLIWAIDTDFDGKVSREEFQKMLDGTLFQ